MSVTLPRLKPPSTAHRQLRPPLVRAEQPHEHIHIEASPPALLPAGDYSVCPQVFFFSRVSGCTATPRTHVRGSAVKRFSYS